MKLNALVLAGLGSLIFWGGISPAQAAMNFEAEHAIATGAGVSAPSVTDAIADNPAGLMYSQRLHLLAGASSEEKDFDPFSAIGRAVVGNGSVGITGGVHTVREGKNTKLYADYGLGAYANSIDAAIGVGVSSRVENAGFQGDQAHLINVGVIGNPRGDVRAGFTAIGILSGPEYYNTGIAGNLSPNAILSVDASSDKKFKSSTVEPALGVHTADLHMSLGYGVRINKDLPTYIREGFTAGAGLQVGKDVVLEGVYNHHVKYYVALVGQF